MAMVTSDSETTKTVASFVSHWRHENGWSRSKLAKHAKLSRSVITRIEEGKEWPTPKVLLDLVKTLPGAVLQDVIESYLQSESRCGRLVVLADLLLDDGRISEADRVMCRATLLDSSMFAGRYRGELHRVSGRLLFAQGDFDGACQRFSQMVAAAQGHGHALRRGRAAYDYGLALIQCQRWVSAIDQLLQSIRAFEQVHHREFLGRAHWALGTCALRLRDFRTGEQHYAEAAALLRDSPLALFPTFGILICRWTEGDDVLPGLQSLSQRAPATLRPVVQHMIGVALRQQGQATAALESLNVALAGVAPHSSPWVDTQCERLVCLCLTNRLSEAASLWKEIMHWVPQLDPHNYEALAIAGLAFGLTPHSVLLPT